MSQYKSSTVSVTNGSAIVTGSSTEFLENVSVGDGFIVTGHPVVYDIASVDSDTQVTLSAPYSGPTNPAAYYAIHRDFTSPDNIPELKQGDIETGAIFTRAMRRIQSRFTEGPFNITIDMK